LTKKVTATQEANPLNDYLIKTLLSPDFLPILAVLFGCLLLAMFSPKKKYGQLADGRMAFEKEKKAARRKMIDRVKKPERNWAALYVAEPLGCEVPNPGNIHKFKGNLVPVIDIDRGTFVVGNQGAGKSESIINQLVKSAIEQGFGIIWLDMKYPAGSAETVVYGHSRGYDIRVLAPGYAESSNVNILDAIKDEDDSTSSEQTVNTLRSNLGNADVKRDPFWDGGGESIVSGCFLLCKWIARLEGNPELANLLLADAVAMAPNLGQRLKNNIDKIPYMAYRSFGQLTSASSSGDEKNDTEASLQSVASNIMKPLISSRFIDVVAGTPDFPCFDPDQPFWVGEKNMVVLGVSDELKSVVLPLIVAVLEILGNYNLSSRRDRIAPLVIFLDEFAQIKLDVVLDTWLPLKRSRGASIVIGIQYLAQMTENWGETGKDKVMGCANKFIGNPGSVANAEPLAKELGEKQILMDSYSNSRNGGQHPSQSQSQSDQSQAVQVLDALHLSQFPKGQFVVNGVAVSNGQKGINERVGIPYIHRIERIDTVRNAQEKEAEAIFNGFVESVIAGKAEFPKIDLNESANFYRSLVDKYLPLATAAAPVKQQVIEIAELIKTAELQGFTIEGEPREKEAIVPNDWKLPLSLDQALELIEKSGVKILQKF
jgi:type IV secretory pathway TraG/TraD family ATPase VirD4